MKSERNIFVIVILLVATVIFFAFAARAQEATHPVDVKEVHVKKTLTAEQKLSVRDAQVKILVAAEQLHITPQWKEFELSQQKLQQVMADVQKSIGNEYTLDGDLNVVKKPEAKK